MQFYPLLAIPIILLNSPAAYTRTSDVIVALALYALAKGLENMDKSTHTLTFTHSSMQSIAQC